MGDKISLAVSPSSPIQYFLESTGMPSQDAAQTWDKFAYFDGEARIARDASNPLRLNPEFPLGARVLSVGCGGGWEGESEGAGYFVGVDVDEDARRYRIVRGYPVAFCLAGGERLPFRDESFTYYVARVSLMYMDIPRCLAEAYRVLAPDGRVWLTCHDFRHARSHLRENLRAFQAKAAVFRAYVIANGLLFHAFGVLARFPLSRSRIESFQTRVGIRRALERAGFGEVAFPVTPGGQFLVTAHKPT